MDPEQIYARLNEVYFAPDGGDERQLIRVLAPILRRARFFVDVGASLGQYTWHASQLMSQGRIIAVEADPVRFERLAKNCEQWRRPSVSIESVHAAVTDYNGAVSFNVTNSPVSGGLFRHDLSHLTPEQRRDVVWNDITVPARTLDVLCGGEIPDLIKIDVEGAELSVLRGATGVLASGVPVLMIELHRFESGSSHPEDVIKLAKDFGYSALPLHGHHVFVNRMEPLRRIRLQGQSLASRLLRRLRRALPTAI